MPREPDHLTSRNRGTAVWPPQQAVAGSRPDNRPVAWQAFTGESRGIRPRFSAAAISGRPESHLVPPHQHPDYELLVVVGGNYRCKLNNTLLNLRPWEGVLIKPGDWHEDTCEWPVVLFVLRFDILSAWGGTCPPVFQSPCSIRSQLFRSPARIRQCIRELGGEIARNDPFAYPLQTALLRNLFWLALRALPAQGVSAHFLDIVREQGLAQQLMRYFHARITSVLTVSGVAHDLGMSESSLAHKCKAVLGVSPVKAFQHCKMDHAKDLLENTAMSCKEIGAHLGFDEPAHFTRSYKRAFGKAPALWRRDQGCSSG